ncbi:MAG: hypothetical protein AB4426_00105 [Xenococcaceae cyanobacterium]
MLSEGIGKLAMAIKVNNTSLAFLLALKDSKTSFNKEEQKIVEKVVYDLNNRPNAWEVYTQPLLIKLIQEHSEPQLQQDYQLYKSRLDVVQEIPVELLPYENATPKYIDRSGKHTSPAKKYERQINNAVLDFSKVESREEANKKYTFFDKIKEFLVQPK